MSEDLFLGPTHWRVLKARLDWHYLLGAFFPCKKKKGCSKFVTGISMRVRFPWPHVVCHDFKSISVHGSKLNSMSFFCQNSRLEVTFHQKITFVKACLYLCVSDYVRNNCCKVKKSKAPVTPKKANGELSKCLSHCVFLEGDKKTS